MTDLTYTLDQIDAACENATDGPWRWDNSSGREVHLFGDRHRVVMAFDRLGMQGAQPLFRDERDILQDAAPAENINDFADAAFIALARTALPELAAKVRELEAAVARVDALHRQPYCSLGYPQDYCAECDHTWPCPTIRALKETP